MKAPTTLGRCRRFHILLSWVLCFFLMTYFMEMENGCLKLERYMLDTHLHSYKLTHSHTLTYTERQATSRHSFHLDMMCMCVCVCVCVCVCECRFAPEDNKQTPQHRPHSLPCTHIYSSLKAFSLSHTHTLLSLSLSTWHGGCFECIG